MPSLFEHIPTLIELLSDTDLANLESAANAFLGKDDVVVRQIMITQSSYVDTDPDTGASVPVTVTTLMIHYTPQ